MKKLKEEIRKLLLTEDFQKNPKIINVFPPQKTASALFSFLYSTDKIIKENAVIAMGEVVSNIAEQNIEQARIIMRRLMLSLTEESGGIGWGAPLAMGEIMARNSILAEEYHKILFSYAEEDDNFLDFEELQKEVVTAIHRVSEVHPHLFKNFNIPGK